MEQALDRAHILIEALPYIRKFHGRTVVVKYGGNAMISPELKSAVMQDLVLMKLVGINPVVVHGGGPEITAMLKRVGKKSEFVGGLRITDAETMEIVEMVLVGKINKEIVAQINHIGGRAVGLSGKDAGLIKARKKLGRTYSEQGEEVFHDIGYVGEVEEVNPAILESLIHQDYIPVVAPVGVGEEGESYNINADTVAGEIAAALKADKLILLTDVPGILADPADPSTLISVLKVEDARHMIKEGRIDGGMIPKVECCMEALAGGVATTHIIDGRLPHSLLLELFTDAGIGTMVVE